MHILTRLSLNKIPIVIMLAVLIIGGGLFAATQLKSELLPNFEFPLVSVVAIYPGAAPDDVRRDVTEPIEKAIGSTANLETITSRSNDSVAFITAQYQYGTDMEKTQQELEDALNKITFPSQVQRPTVGRFSFNDVPVLSYSINTTESGDDALFKLKQEVDKQIVPELQGIAGVNRVALAGGGEQDVLITLDEAKLAAAGQSASQVLNVLRANNLSFPTGEIVANNQTIPVRVAHQFESVDDLKKLVVGYKGMPMGAGGAGAGAGGFPGAGTMPGTAPGGTTGTAPGAAPGGVVTGTTPGDVVTGTTPSGVPGGVVTGTTGTTPVAPGNVVTRTTPIGVPGDVVTGTTGTTPAAPGGVITGTAGTTPGAPGGVVTGTTGVPGAVPGAVPGGAGFVPPVPEPVTLGDVAAVELKNIGADNISRTQGKSSLSLVVYKNQNANTVQVADAINAKVAELKDRVPGSEYVLQFDSSVFIKDSLNSLIREGILGAVLAIIMILIFLGSFRSTIVAGISIPMSLLIAFILLNFFNVSLNIMTLAGLAVAVGRVVDDSIVVLENIYRHHFQQREPIRVAALNGTREVAMAITASTLTTVSVFLPLGFIAGLVSEFFRPFAIAVSIALLASLLVALTLVPVLASLLLKTDLATYNAEKHQRDTLVQRAYTPAIRLVLRNRWTKLGTVLAAVLLFVVSLIPIATGAIGFSFLSFGSDKVVSATVQMKPGTDLATTDETAKQLEAEIGKNPAVETYQTTIGSNSNAAATGFFALGSNSTIQWTLTLKHDANLDQEADWVRALIDGGKAGTAIADYTVSTGTGAGPSSNNFSAVVSGANYDDVLKNAQALTDKLKTVPDLVNVTNDASTAKPEIRILVDPEKALQHGSTTIQIATQVRSLLTRENVTSVTIGDRQYDVLAAYDPTTLNSLDKIKALKVGAINPVPLSEVAAVDTVDGPVSITRVDQEGAITVQGTINAKSTTSVQQAAQAAINELADPTTGLSPDGTKIAVTGVIQQQTEAFGQLGFAILISIALVYIIMVTTFGSLSTPFVILFSLPLAAIGSLFALWITGQPLGISAMIGVLMLVGIVVTNAIVLLDLVEQLKDRGMPTDEALIEGGRTRVRPILMTALATIIALIPLAAGGEGGTLIAAELGIVVIGGLFSSTLLTLLVVPVIYSMFDGLRGLFTRRSASDAHADDHHDGTPAEDGRDGLAPGDHSVPPRLPAGTGA